MKKQTQQTTFQNRLLLNQWLLDLLDADNFDELASHLRDNSKEGWDAENISYFYRSLTNREPCGTISHDLLRSYDANIFRHTQHINRYRQNRPIRWKYFQYLSLLFTEIYLDRYFEDPESFSMELNRFMKTRPNLGLSKYQPESMNKIAFWSATGSGKTLIMHVNILQYLHYIEKHKRDINNIILLTPNEGLSKQHLEEITRSNIPAILFSKERNSQGSKILAGFRGQTVDIIDIHKIGETSGEKTVAVEYFENNNLILVDEGHRGASGATWMQYRNRLTNNGFSFEYSATFGQAFGKGSADTKLKQEYAKCILFDYSYRFFYQDGYGKDFRILNFSDGKNDMMRYRYLTACLLMFYQQLRLYEEKSIDIDKFNIEKPLCLFVGGSVNSVRKQDGREVSDVLDILLFIAEFIADEKTSKDSIRSIISGKHGLSFDDTAIFSGSFDYLRSFGESASSIFADLKKRIFNGTGNYLNLQYLKGSDELALKLGEDKAFGVINVGDGARLKKLCEKRASKAVRISEHVFTDSHFENINRRDSNIKILIGAKKFTEGWNSWRVSTMGLMNVGKGEGAQIIQLFGRGVRLKGHGLCLKRSIAAESDGGSPPRFGYMENLETLHIFGVRSDYMEQFKQILEEEEIRPFAQISLPVLLNLPNSPGKSSTLNMIRIKRERAFEIDVSELTLSYEKNYFDKHKVILDRYPSIQREQSMQEELGDLSIEKHSTYLRKEHVNLINFSLLYLDLQEFKRIRKWHNLHITEESLRELLGISGWYTLYIPEEQMQIDNLHKNIPLCQDIATTLLRKYVESFYNMQRTRWEQAHLEYQPLKEFEPNLLWDRSESKHHYTIQIDSDHKELIRKVSNLAKTIEKEEPFDTLEFDNFTALRAKHHLYEPLIHLRQPEDESIKVNPVALNDGERLFIDDLEKYADSTLSDSNHVGLSSPVDLYLLRNQSKLSGLNFFANGKFFPDFILWLISGQKQYINFIEPHSIRNSRWGDEKLNFHKKIKEIEKSLGVSDPNIVLNSFLISTTPYQNSGWWSEHTIEDFSRKNVFFQGGDPDGSPSYNYIDKIIRSIVDTG